MPYKRGFLWAGRRLTATHLVGTRIFRIRCCGQYMAMETMFSRMPDEEYDGFGYVSWYLYCHACERRVQLDTLPDNKVSTSLPYEILDKEPMKGSVG